MFFKWHIIREAEVGISIQYYLGTGEFVNVGSTRYLTRDGFTNGDQDLKMKNGSSIESRDVRMKTLGLAVTV